MARMQCSPVKGEPNTEIVTKGNVVVGWVRKREHGEYKWGALKRDDAVQGAEYEFSWKSKKEAIRQCLLEGKG